MTCYLTPLQTGGEGMPMLTLYLAPGSSSMAPHIALHAPP
jgi:hypothetical protein